MKEVKLSRKNQIVLPREVREALAIKPGDRMIIVIRGDTVILLPKPKEYAETISGMGKDIYPESYVETERREGW